MTMILTELLAEYRVDGTTVLLIGALCGGVAYLMRERVTNIWYLVMLWPLFFVISLAAYALALDLSLFNQKRHAPWIMYSFYASAIGCSVGILLIALLRRIQDAFVTRSHIRQTLKRDAEQVSKGHQPVQL